MGSMRKSCLSRYKQGRLIEHFVVGTTGQDAFGGNIAEPRAP